MVVYPLARSALFRLDAEAAHRLTLRGLALASRSHVALASFARSYAVTDPRLNVSAFGLEFPNPLGLAAGLDKDGEAIRALSALGFGAVEVGSVTASAQSGNPKPRLFRLVDEEAIINRMGFNNHGAAAMAQRLRAHSAAARGGLADPAIGAAAGFRARIGVNVGRSRAAGEDQTLTDYELSLRQLWRRADYLALNVSSPNTPGLRDLQRPQQLAALLDLATRLRAELGRWPVLVKIAPDLDDAELVDVTQAAVSGGAAGIIATNTTLQREGVSGPTAAETGGLSGRPLAQRSLAVLSRLRELTELPLVSVGGIFSAQDAVERLAAGADLLQLYTSFIYRGPAVIGEVLRGVLAELDRLGLPNVAALKGASLS